MTNPPCANHRRYCEAKAMPDSCRPLEVNPRLAVFALRKKD